MKKLTCILLVIVALVLTGCHEHTWTEATCTQPMTCKDCGETIGDTLEHTWIAANCTHPKYCEVCNEEFGTAIPHIWASATCLKPETCTKCGETQGEVKGHNFENKYCTRCKAKDPDAIFFDDFGYINNYGMTDWIQISGYKFSEGCVYIKENHDFNFIYLENNVIKTERKKRFNADSSSNYTFILDIFSNDRIAYGSAESMIFERVCKDNMLVLKVARESYEEWYVPLDLLDTENIVRKTEPDSNGIEFEYYYFYFK